MDDLRPILYGVSDYAQIRRKNGWFIDRTAKIRDLEATAFALFLRPRRFGKSLFLSILEAYYDIDYADRFEELFSGTDIGKDPTDEHNTYLVLPFDFSAIKKNPGESLDSFNLHVCGRIDAFVEHYAPRFPEGKFQKVLDVRDSTAKLDALFNAIRGTNAKVYVFIDEYDNFTNTILAESGMEAYNDLCHGDGFFKQFFTSLKMMTTAIDAPVKRIFITGVSPVTMDDVTSGFNIGTNISLLPQFADLTGFRHDDLRAIADYYAPRCGFDAEKAYDTAVRWYDNYRFGSASAPTLANTTTVLSFFNYLWQTKEFPPDLIDENLRTDYAKIRHLVTAGRRLNGNFHILENLVAGGCLSERLVKSFQARELSNSENFTSLLYWLGITTITGERRGKTVFGIPNETLKELAAKMIPDAYADIHRIDERVFAINDGLVDFSYDGKWMPFVGILARIVGENFAVRDSVDGEKVVQSTLVALLTAAGGPYFVKHERESGGGFYDIALAPQLSRWPGIAHAALIEMKYVKAGDPVPASGVLEKIRSDAIGQLDRYSADPALVREWCVGNGVTLHRLVLVFHGGDCILSEEV
ncbi:MAG: AAA family ATPase [Kiritimatiellae bacterium]|nr:AAA family ATPase [Kiritimatiellia bacterium]